MSNVINVTANLMDVGGTPINDKVIIDFYNQRVTSLSQRFTKRFNGEVVILKDIPSFPDGFTKIVLTPTKYRSKAIFKNISVNDKSINEIFFINPKHANPKLLDFADIENKSYGRKLRQILDNSNIDANVWNRLDKRNRATIFNLSSKIANLEREYHLAIFDQIEKIEAEQLTARKRARIFARVKKELFTEIRDSLQVFGSAPGISHTFYGNWRLFSNNSFKSRDKAGNIQFTFAKNNDDLFLADIDLDDSSGIQHVIDVIKHTLTQNDTDPYDIHQILKYFQNIDPEYSLI